METRHTALGGVILGLAALGCGGTTASGPPPGDPLDLVSAEQLYQLGLQLEAAGDSIRAEQYLAAAIEQGHPEEVVMPALLRVCVQASRFGDALDYAEPYLARHPEEWALHVVVASIYMALVQPEPATHHLEMAIELAPDQPSGHYLLGVLARDQLHDSTLAHDEFARYLELDPEGEHAAEARIEIRRAAPTTMPVRLPPEDGAADPPASDPLPVATP